MKNNKLFNKTFILVTVLFTAFVVLASCSNAAAPKKINSDSQGIVVSGSFTFDGMTSGNTSASRSAVPSYSEFNETDYYGVVLAYRCNQIIVGYTGGKNGGEPIYGYQKQDSSISSGTIDFSTNKWKIVLPGSGHYCIEVQLFIKDEDPEDDVPVLKGESAATEIDSAAISSHLNSTIAWTGEPVRLLPNPGYANDHNSADNMRWANVPFNLGFRYPKGTDISTIYGLGFEYKKGQTVSWNPVEGTEVDDVDENYTLLTVTGNKKINSLYKNGNNYPNQPEPYSGSETDLLYFLDSNRKVLYTCNESITAIPGFTTDTWNWDDENDPHYYKDSNGKTYFNITQEMLDAYQTRETYKMDTASGTANHEYPVVLFDNSSSDYGYSIVKNFPTENATLNDGLALASGRTVLDFAIAPIDSNTRKSSDSTNIVYNLTNFYSTTEQQIFTAERDGSNNIVIVKYPTYTGYTDGEVVASLEDTDETDVLSMYAAYDGYIYLLLGSKGSYTAATRTMVTDMKRVCVKQNTVGNETTKDSLYGLIQDIKFNDGTNDVEFLAVIHGNTSYSSTMFYKIAAYNYGIPDNQYTKNYIYVSYVDATDYYNVKVSCDRIPIPYTYDDSPTVTIDPSSIERFSKLFSDITASNQTGVFFYTYVSDVMIIPEKASGNQQANMYLLLHGPVPYDGTPYGGIVKVEYIEESTTDQNPWGRTDRFQKINNLDNPDDDLYIRGWYTGNTYPLSNEMNLLYAPTRFVARKPDELVIADEKSYIIDNEHGYNEDRVVTVDLQSFSELTYQLITSARKVSTKFGWEIEVTCNGTNFIRY